MKNGCGPMKSEIYQLLPDKLYDRKSRGTKSKGLPDKSTSPVWTVDILPLLQNTLRKGTDTCLGPVLQNRPNEYWGCSP